VVAIGARSLHRFYLAGGLLLLMALEATAAEPKRVLLLHSFGPHFAPWNVMSAVPRGARQAIFVPNQLVRDFIGCGAVNF